MKKTIPFLAVMIIVAACQKTSAPAPVSDKSLTQVTTDINEPGKYTSVRIGIQKWMTTNLAVNKYRNGDRIPQVTDQTAWAALTTGAWCWYKNDSATYAATYGKLYNWYAVNDPRGLAPIGWHIPSNVELDTLANHLGNNAGGKMKEIGTTHWLAPNTHATNKSGFTALPGGYRSNTGVFAVIGDYGSWWTSTPLDATHIWYYLLKSTNGDLYRNFSYLPYGLSVRCIRD